MGKPKDDRGLEGWAKLILGDAYGKPTKKKPAKSKKRSTKRKGTK